MIEPGRSTDADAILALTRSCGVHLRAQGIDQWDENYPDPARIADDLKQGTLFCYRDSGTIAGIIVLNETQDEEYAHVPWGTTEAQKNLVVHRLAVHPDNQGQGIARQLMDFAEDFAQRQGYDAIRLDTFSRNTRNQRFYLNRGYTEKGLVYLPYKKEHPYHCYELLLK